MTEITTQQEYIDDVLYPIQCCLARLMEDICNAERIGACADREDVKILYAYMFALTKHDMSDDDDDKCLTDAEINRILDRVRVICNECCDIGRLNESDDD